MAVMIDRWSKEMPTEPGLYWWRYRGSNVTMIITVARDDQGALWVQQGTGREVPLGNWGGGLWAGPVTPPRIADDE